MNLTSGYIFVWLSGYSALLGPIAGILIFDYYLLRRRTLNVVDLYEAHGEYRYQGGFNVIALVAFAIGVAPNVPGFLVEAGALAKADVPMLLQHVYKGAWFVGFFLAGLSYLALMAGRRPPAPRQLA